MRGIGITIVSLVLAATVVSAQQVTPAQIAARQAELQKVFDAYVAGDREAVTRAIPRKPSRDRADSATRVALSRMLGDGDTSWSPSRAAFTLEVAVALYRSGGFGVGDAPQFLRLGRPMVTGRPNPIGSDASEDRLEVLWHQIALALLQGAGAWDMHNDYITALSARVDQFAKVKTPVANRLALARAINATMQCCRGLVAPLANQLLVITSGRAKPETTVVRPNDAIALFDTAAVDPALHDEALVRGAFLESFLNRLPDALARLDRAPAISDDTLAYAAALIRGAVLDSLDRPDAAADAYDRALQLAPTMQVPAIGRAAALYRAGRMNDAVAAAGHARRLAAGGLDPWPIFLRADERFVTEWIHELRTLLR